MYTKEELEKAVKISFSYNETLRNLGRQCTGSAHNLVKKNINKYGIDIRHFIFKAGRNQTTNKLHYNEILIDDQDRKYRRDSHQLRRALIESGREYKCEKCGIHKWLNEHIILEVDHINGDWRNNLDNNLRFLCPNCHSLTPNFYHTKLQKFCDCGNPIKTAKSKKCSSCAHKGKKGHSQRKTEWPTKEYLGKLLLEKPITKIAKQFVVSDSTVIKWCKHYGLKRPGRGYWSQKGKL